MHGSGVPRTVLSHFDTCLPITCGLRSNRANFTPQRQISIKRHRQVAAVLIVERTEPDSRAQCLAGLTRIKLHSR